MPKLFKRSRANPLQPQSVNPRQGTVSPRLSSYQQPSVHWWARHKLLVSCFVLILLSCLTGLAGYVILDKWLTVKIIEVNQQVTAQPTITTADQVKAQMGPYQQHSLVLLDDMKIINQLKNNFADIEQIRVTKKYPNSLIIDYIPHVPLAQLRSPKSTFLVNRQGIIFAKAASDNLPQIITSDPNIAVGQNISAQGLKLSLDLIKSLRQTKPAIKSITLENHQLNIALEANPQILVGQQQNSDQMTKIIQDLLYQFEQQQKTPRVVDLRFDRPVLQY